MKRYALSTQMFFLFQRVNQLSGIKQPDLFEGKTFADYMLAKDTLFAKLTLDDNEFQLYLQLYNHLRPQAATPDLVIYLQASVDQLLARIQRRGRIPKICPHPCTEYSFLFRSWPPGRPPAPGSCPCR